VGYLPPVGRCLGGSHPVGEPPRWTLRGRTTSLPRRDATDIATSTQAETPGSILPGGRRGAKKKVPLAPGYLPPVGRLAGLLPVRSVGQKLNWRAQHSSRSVTPQTSLPPDERNLFDANPKGASARGRHLPPVGPDGRGLEPVEAAAMKFVGWHRIPSAASRRRDRYLPPSGNSRGDCTKSERRGKRFRPRRATYLPWARLL
jgi:hypothetical protein